MKHSIRILLVISALTGAIYALAEAPEGKGPMPGAMTACKEEAQKLCPNLKPGPELQACMQQNKDKVSETCQKLIRERQQARGGGQGRQGGQGSDKRQAAMAACKEDLEKNCKDIQPGGGRIIKCLKEKEASLSEGCKAFLKEARGPK